MCYYREDPRDVKNFRRLISFIVISVLAISCDAPHLNPLDPSNSDSQYGQLNGVVTNSSNQSISNVQIIWKNQSTITSTDSLGRYNFANLELKDGWLYFQKSGYQSDSIYIEWKSRKNVSVGVKQLFSTVGMLDGSVFTSATPGQAIPDVSVIWKNQNIIALTDASGYFKFNELETKDGYVYYQKNGFVQDSTYVQWNKQSSVHLDNKRLNFSQGSIKGSVLSLSLKPIAGARVTLKSKGIVVQTKSDGTYQITGLLHQDDTLLFQATGYSSDSAAVHWSPNAQDVQVDTRLNADPKLNDLRIYSSVQNTYTASTASLYIQAKISDEDVGDIDSVYVDCPGLNINKLPLVYNFLSGYFETILDAGDSALPSIESAIGQTFSIIVRDNEGRFFNVGSSFLKRIIRDQITFYSPANGQTVQKNPTLLWKRFQPGFNFSYMVQVYTLSGVPQLVWQKSNISQDDIQVTVNANLISGQNYYWVIWCIDEYQNRSSSKPATFVVQ